VGELNAGGGNELNAEGRGELNAAGGGELNAAGGGELNAAGGGDSLELSLDAMAMVRAAAERAYPAEGCGVLLGRSESGCRRVLRAVAAENRWAERSDRYRVEPDLLRRLLEEEGRGGPQVVGFFHSHPDCDPVPSATDSERAWPWYSYLIVRVDSGRMASMRAWELEGDGNFRERKLRERASWPE